MTALPNSPRSARFGPFRLDITTGELHRQERRVRLQHQPFQILVLLLERAGEMVTRDEIRTRLWGSDTIVEFERSVATAVKKLRQALGDNASRPRYIETLARRGYRWVAPVAWDQTAPAATSGTQTTASASAGVRLVGREGPLAALSASLQRAAAGERQIVLIAGEPGIGKTALIDEFERRALGALPGIRCGRGHCVGEYGSTEAYYPVLEAIGELCRGPDRAAAIAILAAQAPTWLVQFPTLVAAPQRDALRREILGATRKRMLREACNAFEAIASERPLILFFEDFHWADPSSIALVSTIARRRARTRLMIVATYQTVDPKAALCVVRNDLVVHGLAQDISLEPLTESDVRDYVSGDEPGTPPSAELAHLVHRHSDGNPLFIVAALDHLTRGGLISRENGAFQLRVPPAQIDIGVPESLRRMIEIQIERLTKEEREALEVASVMGVSFLVYACAGAMDADCESYEQLYETLSRRHHVVRRAGRPRMADGTSLSRYEFVHAMYREVLYGRQAAARRARLHRRVGEQLERLFSHDRSGSPDLAPELAHHFEAGGEWRRAATYLAIMAETAGRRSVPRDATALLQRAIDLAARLPDAERATIELDLLQKLAAAYLVSFDSRVVHAYETLIARAAHYGSVKAEIRGLIGLAYPSSWVSTKRCLDAVERALMLGETQTDHVLRARVRASCLVRRIWAGGWNEEDAADCRSALAVIRAAGNRRVLAEHVADCTFVDWASSQYRVARRDSVESRAILLEGSDNPYIVN